MKLHILLIGSLYTISVIAEPTIISQSFQGNDFNNADGWNVINAQSGISDCSGIKMFGGWELFGRNAATLKQFEFPPHSLVYIKVIFYQIFTWDLEFFQIWLDDQLVFKQKYVFTQGTNLCGRGLSDSQQQITLTLKHNGPTGIVIFTSSLDEEANNEAWGIRDFEISVEKCPEGCYVCQDGEAVEACKVWILDQSFWVGVTAEKLIGAEGWTVKGGFSTTSSCGGIVIFGGFQKFGVGTIIKRTFDLKPHYRLKIQLLFAKIDYWDNKYAVLKVDGKEVWKKRLFSYDGPWGNICGRSYFQLRELFVRVEADIAHTSEKQTTLEITSTLNGNSINEFWGVRDFHLFYAACSTNCVKCSGPLPKDCIQCQNNWDMSNGDCTPPENFIQLESSFWDDKFTSLEGWALFNNDPGNLISDCGGKTLVGGYNSLGEGATATKKFSLPSHKRLRLILTIYKIDTWDNEWLIIKFDGVTVWKRQYNVQMLGTNFCGIQYDQIDKIDEIIVHTSPQLEIQISSSLDSIAIDESWGFREFKLLYEPKEECVVFYTECDYKGSAFDFCVQSPDFQKDSVLPTIKSIIVPPQKKVTFYEFQYYKGKKASYTTNQKCIDSIDVNIYLETQQFSINQQSGIIEYKE